MPELPSNLYPAASTILYGLLGAALGVIGYFLKDIRQQIASENQRQDQKINAVETEIHNLKENLPQKYVLRDDFIRAIANLDNKVDTIFKEVSDMNKNLNQLIGGGK